MVTQLKLKCLLKGAAACSPKDNRHAYVELQTCTTNPWVVLELKNWGRWLDRPQGSRFLSYPDESE